MMSRLLFVFFLVSCSAYGQTVVTLVSADDNSPVALASIKCISGTGSIFSANTSDRGSFSFSDEIFGRENHLILEISAQGFETQTDSIKKGQNKFITVFRAMNSLDEFVVTGQMGQTKLDDAVQKARIIDRKTIDAKGAVNLRDVLQSEVNIRLTQDAVLGSGLNMQGMNGQNVKILIDGVPVIGRVDGEIDLSQINLATIERIEIVEGPSSVSYGSNALAGTINLITKKKLKRSYNAQLNSYYETVGNYNLDALIGVNLKRSQFQVYGQRNYFDGWNPTDPFAELPKEKIADSGRFQLWKPKMQYQGGVKWIIPIRKMTFTPYADYFYEKVTNRGMPRAPYYNSAFDDFYVTNRANTGLQLDIPIGKWKAQGVVAYNYYERIKNTYLTNLNTLGRQLSISPADHDTTRFTALMSRTTFFRKGRSEKYNYEIGYDVNRESAFGHRIQDSEKTITESAVFSNVEMLFGKFTLRPGIRATYNSTYKESFTPALNAKYATTKWNFRAALASGFRSPGIKELYLDFVDINHNITGNPDLKPERSLHAQTWVGTKRKINESPFSIDMNVFYQKVTDRISLSVAADGVTYSYFNLDYFESTGSQLAFDFRPGKHSFRITTAAIGTRSNLTTNEFAISPEITFAGAFNWEKAGLTFASFYKYTGKVQTFVTGVDGTVSQSSIEDYHMLDFNVSRAFLKKNIIVTAGGKSLLDVRSIGIANSAGTSGAHSTGGTSTPVAWGRSAYIRLQFILNSKK